MEQSPPKLTGKMELKNYIDSLIGKPISLEINGTVLFPFGKPEGIQLTLTKHSIGFYSVMMDKTCLLILNALDVKSHTVEFLDDEVSVIKWDKARIVSVDNI